jgi:hypothetical protein
MAHKGGETSGAPSECEGITRFQVMIYLASSRKSRTGAESPASQGKSGQTPAAQIDPMSRKVDFDRSFPDEEDLWVDLPDNLCLSTAFFRANQSTPNSAPYL